MESLLIVFFLGVAVAGVLAWFILRFFFKLWTRSAFYAVNYHPLIHAPSPKKKVEENLTARRVILFLLVVLVILRMTYQIKGEPIVIINQEKLEEFDIGTYPAK